CAMKGEAMGWRLQDCAGICLAEAMIAMAAGVVVLSATIQTLNHFQQKLWAQHDAIAHHQDLRVGMGVMEAELRVAGAAAPAIGTGLLRAEPQEVEFLDRKSTRLNSSHEWISYAVFCLKKKKT